MMRILKNHYPLILAVLLLQGTLLVLLVVSIHNNAGNFCYALDDPFIHMAIAKNFAEHAVWGLTRYEFSSTSSSLLYTLLLSLGYYIFKPDTLLPLVLNILFATLLIAISYLYLKKSGLKPVCTTSILLSIIFMTPLPALILTGMEHTLHAVLMFVFVYLAADILSSESAGSSTDRKKVALPLAGLALTATRYEGIFVVFIVCVLLICSRRWRYSLALGAISLLPATIYGIISVHNGSFFLPNTLLMKGGPVDFLSFRGVAILFVRPLHRLYSAPWLSALTIACLALYIFRHLIGLRFWEKGQLMITITTLSLFLHLDLAGIGWVYRYEAYLVALAVLLIGSMYAMHHEFIKKHLLARDKPVVGIASVFLCVILGYPLVYRGAESLGVSCEATSRIYEYHYQAGLFLRDYYQGQAIAINDVGAMNFLADVRTLDLWGLENVEVVRAKRNGIYTDKYMDSLATSRNVKIAMINAALFKDNSIKWTKVGVWRMYYSWQPQRDSLCFYAVDPAETSRLRDNLSKFSQKLPKSVHSEVFLR